MFDNSCTILIASGAYQDSTSQQIFIGRLNYGQILARIGEESERLESSDAPAMTNPKSHIENGKCNFSSLLTVLESPGALAF
jgi:hypothetical protein